MAAGYSGMSLVKKLGIRSGMNIAVLGAPADYFELLADLPDDVAFLAAANPGTLPAAGPDGIDMVHVFTRARSELEGRLPELRRRIRPDGMIWISWPKQASGVASDLNGNVVRDAGLAVGLVDVKVCAVDATWSGLKFVIPLADRDI
jgi:hypothetical protein